MANSKLLPEERRKKILELLKRDGSITVNEIAKIVDVSLSTVRNDLRTLKERGLIHRVHGGAIVKETYDPLYQKGVTDVYEAKLNIAKRAIEFVEEGDFIFVDAGSTTLIFLEELIKTRLPVHVITNSLYVINALTDVPHISVYVIGGEFRRRTMNFVEPELNSSEYRIFKAFMGIGGFDEEGYYVTTPVEAKFKKKIITIAKKVYILADSRKFGKVLMGFINNWTKKDTLITDKKLPISVELVY